MKQQDVLDNWNEAKQLSNKLGLELFRNTQSEDGIFILEKKTEISKGINNVKQIIINKDILVIVSFLKGVEYQSNK